MKENDSHAIVLEAARQARRKPPFLRTEGDLMATEAGRQVEKGLLKFGAKTDNVAPSE